MQIRECGCAVGWGVAVRKYEEIEPHLRCPVSDE